MKEMNFGLIMNIFEYTNARN